MSVTRPRPLICPVLLHEPEQRLGSDHTLNTIHLAAADDRQQAGILGKPCQYHFQPMVGVNMSVVVGDDRRNGSIGSSGLKLALDLLSSYQT